MTHAETTATLRALLTPGPRPESSLLLSVCGSPAPAPAERESVLRALRPMAWASRDEDAVWTLGERRAVQS